MRCILFLACLAPALIGSTDLSALEGLGGLRPFCGTEVYSAGNPATASLAGIDFFTLAYSAPFAGIGDYIGSAGAEYRRGLGAFEAGAEWRLLQSNIYSMNNLGLVLSRRLGRAAIGARGRLFYDSFQRGEFDLGSEDFPDDPVFSEGYSKAAFSMDLGLAFSPVNELLIGLSAENLLDPDLALRDNLESNIGRSFGATASFNPRNLGLFFAEAGLSPSAPDGSEIAYKLGYETPPIAEVLKLNAAFDERDISFGIALGFPWGIPLRFDYSFELHRGDLGQASSGHNLALTGFFERKLELPDLSAALSLDRERYALGDTGFLTIRLVAEGGNFSDVLVGLSLNSLELEPFTKISIVEGEPSLIRLPFTFDSAGVYSFEVNVDPKDEFVESSEDNNSSSAVAIAFAPPQLAIEASPKAAKIDAAKYINQDESIVPAVFFEAASSQIDPRFDPLLELLAERLTSNPDAVFIVNGYFDELSEPGLREIAENRASAVRSALSRLAPGSADRVKIGADAPDRQRIPRRSQYQEYQRLVDSENRRAEISVVMPRLEFRPRADEFSTADAAIIADSVITALRANPMAMLVVRASSAGNALDAAILRALKIKELLLANLPEYYSDRVLAGADDSIPADSALIFLTGDAIAFKPREVHSALSYQPSELPDCVISLSAASEAGISEWRLSLVDEAGRTLHELATGKGPVKKALRWDWKDREGGIIPFGKRFSLCLSALDELGQASKLCTENEIGAEVMLREERIDRLLLVQFIFDGPSAQSSFLEDRLEWVARHIVEKGAQDGVSISAELQGHTDEIGGHRRNIELSEQRAKAVETRLFAYMKGLLGLDSREALDRWMAENEVSISSRGYAASEPYTIEFWEDGKLSKRLIGAEELPEGRTINRRVVVVITETRGTADE